MYARACVCVCEKEKGEREKIHTALRSTHATSNTRIFTSFGSSGLCFFIQTNGNPNFTSVPSSDSEVSSPSLTSQGRVCANADNGVDAPALSCKLLAEGEDSSDTDTSTRESREVEVFEELELELDLALGVEFEVL